MPTHSIWSTNPIKLKDGNTNTEFNTFNRGNAAGLWTEHKHHGYFRAVAEIPGGDIYVFTLVAINNSGADSITGLWNIKYNGTLSAIIA